MLCPNCAYDLRGQPRSELGTFRCPECGETSAGTASRGEVIAAYRSWRGAFGGGLHTLSARYLDSPAIMRTVGQRFLLMFFAICPIAIAFLAGSSVVVESTYERGWSPIDQPNDWMDVDTVILKQRLIPDANDADPAIRLVDDVVYGERRYRSRTIARSVWLEFPPLHRTIHTVRAFVACILLGCAQFLSTTIVGLAVLSTSPYVPRRRWFRRALGLAGYVLLPYTIQVVAIMTAILVEHWQIRTGLGSGASLTYVVMSLSEVWIGFLFATTAWTLFPARDQFRCMIRGASALIALWLCHVTLVVYFL